MCDLTLAEQLVLYLEEQSDIGEWWVEHIPSGGVLDSSLESTNDCVILTGIHGELIDDLTVYFPQWKLRPASDIPDSVLRENMCCTTDFFDDERVVFLK